MVKHAITKRSDNTRKFLYQTIPFNSSVSSCQILMVHVFLATFSGSGNRVSKLTITLILILKIITTGAINKKWYGITISNPYFEIIRIAATNIPEIKPQSAPNSLERFQNKPKKNVPTIGGAKYETTS